MANKKTQAVANTPLWKLAIRLMLPFVFILTIVFTAAELFRSGNLNAITESFSNGTWIPFVATRLAIIVGYGFVMAFLTKSKAKNTL